MELKMEGIKAGYGDKMVVSDITFSAQAGKVTGIVGPNGVGKSTLLKCIAGLKKIQEGKILMDGQDLSAMERTERAKIQAYVPQKSEVSFPMTVEEFVLLGRKPYIQWSLKADDYKIVEENLHYLGIVPLREKYLDEISGGEYQKVMLARALVQEPQILLLDEPTSALDIRHQIEVMKILRKIASEKRCVVLLVMHDLSLIARFTDQALFMKNGKKEVFGDTAEVMSEQIVECVFGIRVKILQTEYGNVVIPMEDLVCITE
ncbi:MAG: ABC transporter ATP-binding protein [Lachnospiraceae bacterium]|nr:ABC transporter ATP-binding protein [Robinsoniella sp.]MDY3767949.1 ABC transporter ATP-binding protein [Lachnospiraceae bacterium]